MRCEGGELNKDGQFVQCEKEGEETLDPYALEIYGDEIEVVLCDEHYTESANDI